jgi:outer membrane protein TolC
MLLAALGCQSARLASRPPTEPPAAGQTAAIASPQPGVAPQPVVASRSTAASSPLPAAPEVEAEAGRPGELGAIQLVRAQSPKAVDAISPQSIALKPLPSLTAQASPADSMPATNDGPPGGQQSGLLGLGDALATSLAMNPDLLTVRGAADVSSAIVRVAGVYPWNPFVQAQFFPNGTPLSPAGSPGGAAGNSNYYIWVMQRFELGHQRSHRQESAQAAFGQTRWNIRQAELTNIAQTERLFFTALYQRQVLELAADTQTLSDRLQGVLERRFQAGIATAVEISNARVAARQARRQRQLADANYNACLLALVQQMGMPPGTRLRLAGDLSHFHWVAVGEAFCALNPSVRIEPGLLATELAEARPDVMAARSGASVAQANLNLSRSARIQDIQAGPIYETADDGTRYLGLRLQRDFGVFNNGSALMHQREAELRQQVLTFNQLKRRATNEAAAAMDRYERARQFAAEGAADADATRSRELEQVVAQFEAGRADILNVLAIQGNLLLDVRASLDLFNEVAQAAAMVTQTTGLPPERLLGPPTTERLPAPPVEELPSRAGA